MGIVGAGRIAQALGCLLRREGESIAGVVSRKRAHSEEAARFIGPGTPVLDFEQLVLGSPIVLIAVSDDAIGSVADRLAKAGMSRGVAIHTAGVYGPEALQILADKGVSCGSLHPLQTVSGPEQGVTALPGSPFGLSASGVAQEVGRRWVRLLRGRVLTLKPGGKPLYHAAAVMASNCTTALLDAALALMSEAGISDEEARLALGPLMRTSLENALAQGPVEALTGPLQRGDLETIRCHLEAMNDARLAESVREFYRAAGLQTLDLARRRGLHPSLVETVRKTLKGDTHETGSSPRPESHEGQK